MGKVNFLIDTMKIASLALVALIVSATNCMGASVRPQVDIQQDLSKLLADVETSNLSLEKKMEVEESVAEFRKMLEGPSLESLNPLYDNCICGVPPVGCEGFWCTSDWGCDCSEYPSYPQTYCQLHTGTCVLKLPVDESPPSAPLLPPINRYYVPSKPK